MVRHRRKRGSMLAPGPSRHASSTATSTPRTTSTGRRWRLRFRRSSIGSSTPTPAGSVPRASTRSLRWLATVPMGFGCCFTTRRGSRVPAAGRSAPRGDDHGCRSRPPPVHPRPGASPVGGTAHACGHRGGHHQLAGCRLPRPGARRRDHRRHAARHDTGSAPPGSILPAGRDPAVEQGERGEHERLIPRDDSARLSSSGRRRKIDPRDDDAMTCRP